MIDERIFERNRNFDGAKGPIFICEKVLILQRDDNTKDYPFYIDLPGGGKENTESAFETFQRETKEEFGINIEKEDIVYAKLYMSDSQNNRESYFIVAKLNNFNDKDIVFGDEGFGYSLVSIEDYLKIKKIVPNQREKFLEYLRDKDIFLN